MSECQVCGDTNATQCGFLSNEVCTTSVCEKHKHSHMPDTQSHLLVEGLEDWITKLTPVLSNDPYSDCYEDGFLRMKDPETNAHYLIKRTL